MNNLFCIISAIGNDYGIFTYDERLEQLVETIESIRLYAPGSDVVIFDISEDPLPVKDVSMLATMINKIELITNDKYVTFLKYNSKDPSPNKFEKKTVGEIQAMIAFLNFLTHHPISYKRVFKIAARYKLNSNFNLQSYDNIHGKCVFLEKENWFDKWVFRIRLWSFDYKDLNKIKDVFYNIQNHTYDLVSKTKKLELIEYTLTKFIEKSLIPYVTVNKIGVTGLKGLDGLFLEE